jgi:tRNA(fMet)-specific endonuclease VapC
MTTLWLLDTNTVAYAIRGEGNVGRRWLESSPGSVAIPAPVLYELEVWLLKSRAERRRAKVEALLASMTVIAFGGEEARSAAAVRAMLEDAGTPIGPVDNLIAGTALVHDAVLVTHNVREFSRVPGLRVDDWYT